MVRKIFCLSLALMLVALAVPAMASTSVWVETPAADGAVNLRSGPGTEYPVIGWAVYGDELVLLSTGNQWYQVQIVKNGKIGFMSRNTSPSISRAARLPPARPRGFPPKRPTVP